MKKIYDLEEVKELIARECQVAIEEVNIILDEPSGEARGYSVDLPNDFSI